MSDPRSPLQLTDFEIEILDCILSSNAEAWGSTQNDQRASAARRVARKVAADNQSRKDWTARRARPPVDHGGLEALTGPG